MAFGAFGGTATASPVDPGARKRSKVALFLLLPGIAYLALFFVVPFFSLLVTSFKSPIPNAGKGQYQLDFIWQNYPNAFGPYGEIMLRTGFYAVAATIIALLFSYPLAYFIGVTLRRYPLLQALGLTLVIAPFFISFLLRTLAWKQLLADEGIVLGTLKAISAIAPDASFNGTPGAVIFGIAYNFIPFMTLPIYASLERLDLRYVEAGGDLYASPVRTFFSITLPLSFPGIISGTLLTFIPASGDYINASNAFLGSTDTTMLGNVIERKFLATEDYPLVATLSILLMAFILVLITFYVRKTDTEELL
jgi:spermidine/putrescine transport system permease protein